MGRKDDDSNTTLVKVKFFYFLRLLYFNIDSNTTLVKVKLREYLFQWGCTSIQIQLLLKLNARKINICNFYYTIKSINGQGF